MDERHLVLEGILLKSPPEEKIRKNYKWHKRHVRLWTDCTLEYFKKHGDKLPLKEPIDLNACLGIIETDEKYTKHFTKPFSFAFCLNMQHRQYHFVAATDHERDQWKRAIADVCGLGERLNRTQEEVHQILNNEIPRRASVSSATSTRSAPLLSASSNPTPCRTASVNSNHEYPITYPNTSPVLPKSQRSDSLHSGNTVDSVFVNDPLLRDRLDIPDGIDSPYDHLPPPKPISGTSLPNPSQRLDRPDYIDLILNKRSVVDDVTYDTPPSAISTTNSVKQKRTNSPCDPAHDTGYIQMESESNALSGRSDFFPTNNRPIVRAESEKDSHFKQFRTVGRQNPKSQSLKPKMKPPPELPLMHKHSTISGRPSIDDGPIFDEIPVMPTKHVKDIVNINNHESPPPVDRCKKPLKPVSPQIDRSTKPKIKKQHSVEFVRTPSDELNLSMLNMSFDAAQLHSLKHKQENNAYTNHTLNNNIETHKHSHSTTDDGEGNYFNHLISNTPFTQPPSTHRGVSDVDPMGNYDNMKLQKVEQRQTPINFKKFYKPPLQRQNKTACSFDDYYYDSLRPQYEQEELPALPNLSAPSTCKGRSFSLDTDYTNFSPADSFLPSQNGTDRANNSYINSHTDNSTPASTASTPADHSTLTVSPSRLGTHYVVTTTSAFSEA